MVKRLFFISLLAMILGLPSCRVSKPGVSRPVGSRPPVSKPASGFSTGDYINEYKDIAISEMKRTGIPASITLAQGMIESDFGRSRLAREANNHFGIKCHGNWTGPTIRHNDDKRNECFRKYRKPEESFFDHSDFLKSESRYSFLFDLKQTDYKGWAKGLRRAGYATNPDYANMLIRTIEENNLWNFDSDFMSINPPLKANAPVKEYVPVQIPENNEMPQVHTNGYSAVPSHIQRVMERNRIKYIIVKEGDTREKLEKELKLLKWELAKYNELNSDFQIVPGQVLYLQPKREKAEPGKEYYNTVEGDSMYKISQLYGIKLKKLYEMNRMEEGKEPEAGKKIWLRSIKPVN